MLVLNVSFLIKSFKTNMVLHKIAHNTVYVLFYSQLIAIFGYSSELPALLLRSDDEMKKVTEARAAAILCQWVRSSKIVLHHAYLFFTGNQK